MSAIMSGLDRPAGHCNDDNAWAEFSRQYDGQPRTFADMTDFELANAVFLVDRSSLDLIMYQTAAKERIRWLSLRLAAAMKGEDVFAIEKVRETVAEVGEDGRWLTCSGCYEGQDGQNVHGYPHSKAFGCTLGGGCSECGGIGARWDRTDYDDMARSILEGGGEQQRIEGLVRRIRAALSEEQPLTGEACNHGWDRAVCSMTECANPYALEPLLKEAADALDVGTPLEGGEEITGPIRYVAVRFGDKVVTAPMPGFRHHHILIVGHHLGFKPASVDDQGFALADETFVGREEAARMALESGQVKKLIAPPYLYSEDIW